MRTDEDLNVYGILETLLSYLPRTFLMTLGGLSIGLALTLVLPAKYTSSTTFSPEDRSPSNIPSSLVGVASRLGITPSVTGNTSPEFYEALVRSRTIIDRVLQLDYQTPNDRPRSLLDRLDARGRGHSERLAYGRKMLNKMIGTSVDPVTAIVTLRVTTRDPHLSAAVADSLVQAVVAFDTYTRRSSAAERRAFVESRMTEADSELRSAEDSLEAFRIANRQFRGSPELESVFERLQRDGFIKQEVLLTLRRQFEEARIAEVNDAKTITIIDPAVPPDEPSSPNLVLLTSLFTFLGLFGGMTVGFVQSFLAESKRTSPDQYQRFQQARLLLQRRFPSFRRSQR